VLRKDPLGLLSLAARFHRLVQVVLQTPAVQLNLGCLAFLELRLVLYFLLVLGVLEHRNFP